MTQSLVIAITDIQARLYDESNETTASHFILLNLAQRGYAQIASKRSDELAWAPMPALIRHFNFVVSNYPELAEPLSPATDDALLSRMDAPLRRRFPQYRMCPVQWRAPDDTALMLLILDEIFGHAIPYKDSNGDLAWRSSARRVREFAKRGYRERNCKNDDDDTGDDDDHEDKKGRVIQLITE